MSQTAHPIADLADPLLGWASQTELELAQQLQHCELVSDLPVLSDQLEKVERLYGKFLQHQLHAGADMAALFAVSPALTLTSLVWCASQLRELDDFTLQYLGGLGLVVEDEHVVSPTAFEELLPGLVFSACEQFEVQHSLTPDVDSASVITQLALQAGMTHSEIIAFLESFDGSEAHQAVDAPTPQVASLDAAELPIFAELIAYKPELAERIVNGIWRLRAFSLAHPGSWFDRDRSNVAPQLPKVIAECVVAELRERPVGIEQRRDTVGVARREMRPRIILNRDRAKVCLRLPEQRLAHYPDGTVGDVQWRVNIDGTTKMYRTGAEWGDRSGFAQTLDITLDHPVRELAVQDVTNGITWDIPVVPADDPALIFSLSGNNFSDKASLHHGQLAILVPDDVQLHDLVSGRDIVADVSYTVAGWRGWEVRECDMQEVASLSCIAAGSSPNVEKVRAVDARQRMRFQPQAAPLANLESAGGLRVHNVSLLAEFPPTPSGHTEIWELIISSYAGLDAAGEIIAEAEPLEIPATGGVFEVFDPHLYDAPWVGEYLIRLRGPRNESFRHECAIVEGARAEPVVAGACPSFRIPTGGGLSEVRLRIRPGAKPLECEPKELVIGQRQSNGMVVVSTAEGDQLPLRYVPPTLRFSLPLVGEPATWRSCRTLIRGTDIDPAGMIRVRGVAEMRDVRISVRNQHGSPIKTARLVQDDPTTAIQEVAAFLNSAQQLPAGRMDVEWTDPLSDRRVSVALVDIVASGIEEVSLEGNTLHIESALERRLGVWVWPLSAPWQPARAFEVIDNQVALPESYIGAGNLAVQLYAFDPMMPQLAPATPGAQAHIIAQEGYFDTGDALGELAAFIAGEGDVPAAPETIPVLWDLINTGVTSPAALPAIRKVFAANPRAALTGLAASLVPAEYQPGRIVAAGLVRSDFGAGAGEATQSAHRAPWIAALELLGQLQASESVAEDQQVLNQLEAIAGKGIRDIMNTARDVTLDTACIDQSTVAIAGMAPAQQTALLDMFFAKARIVPGLLLDESSRLLAVFEAFNRREELVELFSSEQLIQAAVTLLRTLRSTDRVMYALSRIRFDKLDGVDTDAKENRWALAPVVSFILALASRMHAHGLITSQKTLDAATPGWAKMANIVPDLVTSDLISADAIIVAMKRQQNQ
ncbi:MAG: hypothetical protein Q3976_04985 [Corynebacterium sp.]|nr:hypothetical protein [Corynebacterium sp.]